MRASSLFASMMTCGQNQDDDIIWRQLQCDTMHMVRIISAVVVALCRTDYNYYLIPIPWHLWFPAITPRSVLFNISRTGSVETPQFAPLGPQLPK